MQHKVIGDDANHFLCLQKPQSAPILIYYHFFSIAIVL